MEHFTISPNDLRDSKTWKEIDSNVFESEGEASKKLWRVEYKNDFIEFKTFSPAIFTHEIPIHVKSLLPDTDYGYILRTLIHFEKVSLKEFTDYKLMILQSKS